MLIAGGRLVDPSGPVDALRDLRIADGVIVEIGEHLAPRDGEQTIDAGGAVVAPGFIDMHVHLREPGFPEKETIESGTRAALRGGFSAIACMPNTRPALDDPAVIRSLLDELAARAHVRVYPIGAITRGRLGNEPCDIPSLARAGAVAFSDDGNTVMNARVLRDAALRALVVPGVFISHAEDEHLKGDALMHEGAVSRQLGVAGSPAVAEDVIVARDLLIGMETGKLWHIAHLSTAGALAAMLHARAYGANATCEVTPHHLLLTDETVRERGAEGKVNPPLRTEHDARLLRDAVRDGSVDAFATDHAPHTAAEKSGDLKTAAVGFTGLEVAVGAYALAVPDLPLLRFVALLSTNPARILNVAGGTLRVGAAADVTIFAEREWRVDPAQFASKGKATPFAGRVLPRRVLATIVNGALLFHGDAEYEIAP
ncbi:MAG TPA: dihydroorotase [Candidatus Baltobacteraceae bacterium]|nr:dihydroorotase [Candidatus Baltobacteraceae bacterium]